tara:strand:+ start:3011 stop:3292 length:282 start_codon:yes stop_codon:yes gene_type:complete
MTNRKIDWGGYKPMSDAEKKCASQQQYAITALLIITGFNFMFGALMVYGLVPVWLGMAASFAMMIAVVCKAQKDLLDSDEKMWESSDKFRSRR